MKLNKAVIFIIFLCVFMSLACSQLLGGAPAESNASPTAAQMPSNEDRSAQQTTMAGLGYYSGWPDVIPEEIPVLEGEIDIVMEAPGSRIRIFYNSVSEQQITDYLALLEDLGFQLEYICYVEEGFPDTCDEQMARGEYDAVDITRGEYHMRLEAGGGRATYDIYTAAFITPDPKSLYTPTPIVWPADIPSQVPTPLNCEINSIARLSSPGYQITFICQDEDIQAKYIQALLVAGLEETDRLVSDRGEIAEITFEDEQVRVNVGGAVHPYITIQVWFKP